jgi:sodium transport system permease protein
MTSASLIVAHKEIVDHLRDTRSLASALAYALMGPAIVMLVSLSPRGQDKSMPLVILGIMSVFALVSAFVGGMNIAIDITAGERERQSLLPLLITPVTRWDVIIGKWLAASAFTLGALGLNLAGLVVVLALRAPATLIEQAATLASWAILGLAPLALLGASLEILVAVVSRTMKEAGTSLTLLIFVPMLVGMLLVFFPVGGGWWSAVPIVGQQLVIEAGLRGAPASSLQAVVLALVTTLSASAPLAAAQRVLGRDDLAA